MLDLKPSHTLQDLCRVAARIDRSLLEQTLARHATGVSLLACSRGFHEHATTAEGLARIIAYVGRIPVPASWPEATDLVRSMSERAFPSIPDLAWESIARQWFNEADGRPAPGYDPRLHEALVLGEGPLPDIWPQFMALKNIPVMAIRGATSDLFSAATLQEMQRRHPQLEPLTIAGEGHAPMLKDVQSIGAVYDFLMRTDKVEKLLAV